MRWDTGCQWRSSKMKSGRSPVQQREFEADARWNGINAGCYQGSTSEELSVYDEIGATCISFEEDSAIPVYGKVIKPSKDNTKEEDVSLSQEELPAYGRVQTKRSEQVPLSLRANLSEAEETGIHEPMESDPFYPPSQKKLITGADGTEYMDMRAATRLMQPEALSSPPHSPMFHRSQYAEIVHKKSDSK